jgi:peptide deformylase
MLLPIRTLGDPVLREPAKPVERFDRALRQLAKDMTETMYAAPGVGLAGPQVGISLRLFVLDDGEHGPTFIANPELLDAAGEVTEEEGCLSIPGPYHPTTRFQRIRCRGLDAKGHEIDVVGEGLLARILQHETDHLQGMLYIDRLDDEGRKAVLAELRRIELGLAEPRARRRR